MSPIAIVCLAALVAVAHGQRITTIQLDGVQYFISRMNPYSPELNYFLAYQYCRSIGLQLASFETKEKADSIMQYLGNAGYDKYDFWTSGNRLGTDMLIWMSTGLPFNATFDYMRKPDDELSNEQPAGRQLSAVEQKTESGAHDGCVAMTAPDLRWATHDCTRLKDFVCEQTRCYYYNYGSIQVSSAQGSKPKNPLQTYPATTTTPTRTTALMTTVSYQESSETDYSTQQAPSETAVHYQETGGDSSYSTEPTLYDTTETINIRSQKSQTLESNEFGARTMSSSSSSSSYTNNNENDSAINNDVPWPWARNIMLEKPKKKNSA